MNSKIYYTVNFCDNDIRDAIQTIAELKGVNEHPLVRDGINKLAGMPCGVDRHVRSFGKLMYANSVALYVLGQLSEEQFREIHSRHVEYDKQVFYPKPLLLTN